MIMPGMVIALLHEKASVNFSKVLLNSIAKITMANFI
jgi:hypothetical protein